MIGEVAAAVDAQRLWQRFEDLARHGARPDGGVDRPALSEAEAAAKRQLIAWGAELRLIAYTDPLANLFLRMLHQMGIEAKSFGASTAVVGDV